MPDHRTAEDYHLSGPYSTGSYLTHPAIKSGVPGRTPSMGTHTHIYTNACTHTYLHIYFHIYIYTQMHVYTQNPEVTGKLQEKEPHPPSLLIPVNRHPSLIPHLRPQEDLVKGGKR